MTTSTGDRGQSKLSEALAEIKNAILRLESAIESTNQEQPAEPHPAKAGKPWTLEEEKKLIADFNNGLTVRELCEKYERTFGGIQSRLLKFADFERSKSIEKDKKLHSEHYPCAECGEPILSGRVRFLLENINAMCTQCQEEFDHNQRY